MATEDEKLRDQLALFFMAWEEVDSTASRAAELLSQVILIPDAKANFLKCSQEALRSIIGDEAEGDFVQLAEKE